MSKLTPSYLRCEYLVNPLGIDVLHPRFSWILKSNERSQKQTAYQILVASNEGLLQENKGDIWDSGKVESDQSIQIVYQGKSLESKRFYHWKVRVWDNDGTQSDWSEPAFWSMGLLKPTDWKAKWIGAPPTRPWWLRRKFPKRYKPCQMLRKSLVIKGKFTR